MLECGEYASAANGDASFSPSSSSVLHFARGGAPERRLVALTAVLSLLACDGDLSPASFEGLRSELRASARELAASFREVGARAKPVSSSKNKKKKKKGEDGGDEGDDDDDEDEDEEEAEKASPPSSPAGKPHRRYSVKLLVGEKPGTELGACFPALKLGRR